MNCAQFQESLPEAFEGGSTVEQDSHLKSCPTCSSLVADLNLIAREARQLQEVAEPNPRVWNSIELVLRQEGIIRDPDLGPSLVPPPRVRRWSMAWLAPAAALLLVGFGIAIYERGSADSKLSAHLDTMAPPLSGDLSTEQKPAIGTNTVNNDDDQVLAAVASRSPAMQAQYASNLQNVNAYIKDAEASAQADPNDEEAQQIVMDAYEQRATVYEMALDRSLP
jgi:hypothetical protein